MKTLRFFAFSTGHIFPIGEATGSNTKACLRKCSLQVFLFDLPILGRETGLTFKHLKMIIRNPN